MTVTVALVCLSLLVLGNASHPNRHQMLQEHHQSHHDMLQFQHQQHMHHYQQLMQQHQQSVLEHQQALLQNQLQHNEQALLELNQHSMNHENTAEKHKRTIFCDSCEPENANPQKAGVYRHVGVHPSGFKYLLGFGPMSAQFKYVPFRKRRPGAGKPRPMKPLRPQQGFKPSIPMSSNHNYPLYPPLQENPGNFNPAIQPGVQMPTVIHQISQPSSPPPQKPAEAPIHFPDQSNLTPQHVGQIPVQTDQGSNQNPVFTGAVFPPNQRPIFINILPPKPAPQPVQPVTPVVVKPVVPQVIHVQNHIPQFTPVKVPVYNVQPILKPVVPSVVKYPTVVANPTVIKPFPVAHAPFVPTLIKPVLQTTAVNVPTVAHPIVKPIVGHHHSIVQNHFLKFPHLVPVQPAVKPLVPVAPAFAPAPAPAPLIPTNVLKYPNVHIKPVFQQSFITPADAFQTSFSATYPRYPIIQNTLPLVPNHAPVIPQVLKYPHAVPIKPQLVPQHFPVHPNIIAPGNSLHTSFSATYPRYPIIQNTVPLVPNPGQVIQGFHQPW